MAAPIISVLCIIAAVSCANGMMIRRPWFGDGRGLLAQRYLEKFPATTDTEETATEQFYEKESDYYAPKQESVEKIFILSDNALNWTEARSACLESGKMLANPSTPEQRIQLKSYIRDNNLSPPDVFSGYWLGGHREADSGPFKWENGEEIIEGGYSAGWMWGEPNYDKENCVELKSDVGALGFNNFYCHLVKRYICEEIVSQEHAKNIQETNNKEKHEEENKNIMNDLDKFGTILTTPREDISEEIDTESSLASETSDSDEFDTIVVVPENVINDEDDPLISATSDHDQFVAIIQKTNSEEDTKSPSTSDEFGSILMAPKKIISDEIDTESPLAFDTLQEIILASKKAISEEIDTEAPMTFKFPDLARGDIKLSMEPIYNSDASILNKGVEPEVVNAAPSWVDSDGSRLMGIISGDDIGVKTESPIDTMRLEIDESPFRFGGVEDDESLSETSDPDLMIFRKFFVPVDVQTESSDALKILDDELGGIETDRPVDNGIFMANEDPYYSFQQIGIDDYYDGIENVDNWGLDNDDYEQD